MKCWTLSWGFNGVEMKWGKWKQIVELSPLYYLWRTIIWVFVSCSHNGVAENPRNNGTITTRNENYYYDTNGSTLREKEGRWSKLAWGTTREIKCGGKFTRLCKLSRVSLLYYRRRTTSDDIESHCCWFFEHEQIQKKSFLIFIACRA